jgi:hypothetical protein
MTQPKIVVTFRELAASAIARGERGIVAMILKSDTAAIQGGFSFNKATEVPATWDSGLKKQVADAFIGYVNPPRKVLGFVLPASDYTYTAATLSECDNPKAEGWFELAGESYVASQDTIAKSGVTYYEEVEDEYSAVASVDYADNPSTSSWYELVNGAYTASTDTYPVTGKTYFTRSGSKSNVTDYTAAFTYLAGINWQYLVVPTVDTDGTASSVVAYIKDLRGDGNLVKAILPNTNADSEAIINVTTAAFIEDETTYTAAQYCARIAGIIAGTPLTMAATYAPLNELTDCTHISKDAADAAAAAGQFIALWDGEKVKMGRAVNSLVTTTSEKNTQFQKIKIVDAMDMISTDIRKTCEDKYIGKYPNTYSNKLSLIAAISAYFDGLKLDTVIEDYTIGIDVDANEIYLKGRGVDTSEMSEAQIRQANTGSNVFLVATLSMVDAIEDITLKITI